jgi:hypothetical protein
MNFKEYRSLSEATKELYSAMGKRDADTLLNTRIAPEIKKLHDGVFGEYNHHIEIPLHNDIPDSVKEHVKSKGDTLDGENVKLSSGRSVKLSKYLPKSEAPKSTMDAHEHWNQNKGEYGNTKLVITRQPSEVASMSTGTHWDSCARMGSDKIASRKIPAEIEHGTLMAMHVHKDSEPNSDGEYKSKDVLGRTLIKRHDDENGGISFHRENRKYGAFPDTANKAVDDFAKKHYSSSGSVQEKHHNLYDDDDTPTKYFIHKKDIHGFLDSHSSNDRIAAISHPDATPEHINKALDDHRTQVRSIAAGHKNASKENVEKATNDSNHVVAAAAKERLKSFK